MIVNKIVGIDLGTTNSVVAVMEAGKPVVISNAEGFRTTPSIVAYTKKKELLVGAIAKRQSIINPENTFSSVKRFIGSKIDEISLSASQVSYKVFGDDKGNIKIKCPNLDKDFSPEEISSQILRKLVTDASLYLGQPVTQAVITVPAYFNDSQRQATKDAGKIAGIDVLRIINEPTAASLAYGLDKNNNETILIFDLGGGTFDVSILEVGDGLFEVLSTSGDTHLGGDDFDKIIVDLLLKNFNNSENLDLSKDPQALQRLTEAAEKAKIELSTILETTISLPFITATETGPKHIYEVLTRSKFENLCKNLIEKCELPVKNALRDAKINKTKINEVILVGGSTRIPAIQKLVENLTSKKPNQTVNPDEVVALGAAIHAGVLAGEVKNMILLDVTPLSLGVETLGGVMTKLITRNTSIPTKKSEIFSTAIDNQTSVDIHILQGERELAENNKSLGTFTLDGIPTGLKNIPQIEVTFDIDVNGILSVKAEDKNSGKQQQITIKGASTLDKEEIDKIITDQEIYKEADKIKIKNIEIKNQADSAIYSANRHLSEKVNPLKDEEINTLVNKLNILINEENFIEAEKTTKQLFTLLN